MPHDALGIPSRRQRFETEARAIRRAPRGRDGTGDPSRPRVPNLRRVAGCDSRRRHDAGGARRICAGDWVVALVPLMGADSWFNPLALLDLKTGRSSRLAGDGASDLISAAWTRDGQVVAIRQGLNATIWKFTPASK